LCQRALQSRVAWPLPCNFCLRSFGNLRSRATHLAWGGTTTVHAFATWTLGVPRLHPSGAPPSPGILWLSTSTAALIGVGKSGRTTTRGATMALSHNGLGGQSTNAGCNWFAVIRTAERNGAAGLVLLHTELTCLMLFRLESTAGSMTSAPPTSLPRVPFTGHPRLRHHTYAWPVRSCQQQTPPSLTHVGAARTNIESHEDCETVAMGRVGAALAAQPVPKTGDLSVLSAVWNHGHLHSSEPRQSPPHPASTSTGVLSQLCTQLTGSMSESSTI
jgi:hypothetical protein